jgi:hypothetical protein
MEGIPPSIRQDFVRLQQVQTYQVSGPDDEREMASWQDLQQRHADRPNDRTVDFSRRPSLEPHGYDHLGRPTDRHRGGSRGGLR